ncbi:MAG: hypothetical protein ACTS7I_01215 [Candidatus Hodgkinia cicadicola]
MIGGRGNAYYGLASSLFGFEVGRLRFVTTSLKQREDANKFVRFAIGEALL